MFYLSEYLRILYENYSVENHFSVAI